MLMQHTTLSNTLKLSRVVTGFWQIADMERHGSLELNPLADAMADYVKAGLTSFDMADHYGSAEDVAGLYVQRYGPKNVQLLTKWVPEPGAITKDDVRSAVEKSLKRLHANQLDLLQFHTWSYADPSWLDALFYLQELKEEGLIANLGLTNFDTAHLRVALHSGIEIVSNQVCFSLLDQRAKHAMTELCLEHNVKLLAYGTVAGGLLTERYLNRPKPTTDATWSQMKYARFIREAGGWEVFQGLLQTLHKLAQKHGVSIANIACKYILEQPAVGAIIIGARLGSSEHIQDTLRLFKFSLDQESLSEIHQALEHLRAIPGDCGDEYRKPPFLTASGDLSHHLQSFPKPFKTIETKNGRQLALSGTIWEDLAGFSRAVRHHDRILISGTTATHGNHVIGGNDAAAQTHFVIDKLQAALISLGGSLEDVVRTRVFVKHMSDWEVVARVHGQRFREILPANTLVQANLVGDDYLVEIEAEAMVQD
jgi:aryl-alcohol dehydrogenase-like predicted oxidoreductase/enamine deaminase RidA (YjgF/YER057c/UK114 family)